LLIWASGGGFFFFFFFFFSGGGTQKKKGPPRWGKGADRRGHRPPLGGPAPGFCYYDKNPGLMGLTPCRKPRPVGRGKAGRALRLTQGARFFPTGGVGGLGGTGFPPGKAFPPGEPFGPGRGGKLAASRSLCFNMTDLPGGAPRFDFAGDFSGGPQKKTKVGGGGRGGGHKRGRGGGPRGGLGYSKTHDVSEPPGAPGPRVDLRKTGVGADTGGWGGGPGGAKGIGVGPKKGSLGTNSRFVLEGGPGAQGTVIGKRGGGGPRGPVGWGGLVFSQSQPPGGGGGRWPQRPSTTPFFAGPAGPGLGGTTRCFFFFCLFFFSKRGPWEPGRRGGRFFFFCWGKTGLKVFLSVFLFVFGGWGWTLWGGPIYFPRGAGNKSVFGPGPDGAIGGLGGGGWKNKPCVACW